MNLSKPDFPLPNLGVIVIGSITVVSAIYFMLGWTITFIVLLALYGTGLSICNLEKAKRLKSLHADLNQTTLELLTNRERQHDLMEENIRLQTEETGYSKQIITLVKSEEELRHKLDHLAEDYNKKVAQLQEVTDQSIAAISGLMDTNEQLKGTVHEVDLTCAYCNVKQPVLFNIAAGEFKCKACGNTNAIHTNIFTARTNTLLT